MINGASEVSELLSLGFLFLSFFLKPQILGGPPLTTFLLLYAHSFQNNKRKSFKTWLLSCKTLDVGHSEKL